MPQPKFTPTGGLSLSKILSAPIAIGLALAVGLPASPVQAQRCPTGTPQCQPASATEASDRQLQNAFQKRLSNLQIAGRGTVVRLLADDRQGSQHQRFILKLASGQTLLVAHNIDLAPRVNGLQVGDLVEFYGEYEWSPQGGVIHWTHHDPAGRHVAGWLHHKGRTYQ